MKDAVKDAWGVRTLREFKRGLQQTRRLATLAAGPREGSRQVALFVFLYVARRFGLRVERSFKITGSYGTVRVRDHTEIQTIGEVFVKREYDSDHLPEQADVILDIGCNVGAASLWFADRYPHATIIAVEANPVTATLAAHNLQAHDRVQVINAAISDRPGTVNVDVGQESWLVNTLNAKGSGVAVEAITLDDLIGRPGARKVLKIDVEGAEHAAFRGSNRLGEIEFMIGEFHPVDGESWDGMVAMLEPHFYGRRSASVLQRAAYVCRTA